MLAVGEHFLNDLTDRERRMATGFSGGIGGTEAENCGVFSAGVMIIGALYGRISPLEDDQDCQELTRRFRDRFQERFGSLNCGQLRASGYGSGAREPCSTLVERSARILVEVISSCQDGG